jgi:hypothetical protein
MTISFPKYLPWQVMHFLQRSSHLTICRKLQEDNGKGDFDSGAPLSWSEKPKNRSGWDLDCMTDVVMGFHRSRRAHPLPLFNCATLTHH